MSQFMTLGSQFGLRSYGNYSGNPITAYGRLYGRTEDDSPLEPQNVCPDRSSKNNLEGKDKKKNLSPAETEKTLADRIDTLMKLQIGVIVTLFFVLLTVFVLMILMTMSWRHAM